MFCRQQHRLLYHDVKTEVYRCPECACDHASYALLLQHFDQRHSVSSATLPQRPKKADVIVRVAGILVLPRCTNCGYGTLIPYANSYHNCEHLPVFVNGLLIIEKRRQCSHDRQHQDDLCGRCQSYFDPPLLHVNYIDGKFMIDVEKITDNSGQHKLQSDVIHRVDQGVNESNDVIHLPDQGVNESNDVKKFHYNSAGIDSELKQFGSKRGHNQSTLLEIAESPSKRRSIEHIMANDSIAPVVDVSRDSEATLNDDGVLVETTAIDADHDDVDTKSQARHESKFKCADCGEQYDVKTDYWVSSGLACYSLRQSS